MDVAHVICARSWPSVEGQVLSAGIESDTMKTHVGTSFRVHSAQISYAYEIGGRRYENDRISFASLRRGTDYSRARSETMAYHAGTAVEVFYNPSDHSDSVLTKEISRDLIVELSAGVAFLVFGSIGMIKLNRAN